MCWAGRKQMVFPSMPDARLLPRIPAQTEIDRATDQTATCVIVTKGRRTRLQHSIQCVLEQDRLSPLMGVTYRVCRSSAQCG